MVVHFYFLYTSSIVAATVMDGQSHGKSQWRILARTGKPFKFAPVKIIVPRLSSQLRFLLLETQVREENHPGTRVAQDVRLGGAHFQMRLAEFRAIANCDVCQPCETTFFPLHRPSSLLSIGGPSYCNNSCPICFS